MTKELNQASETLKATRLDLLKRANVVAAGVGYKITKGEKTPTLSVICSVANKVKASDLSAKDRVPDTMDGIPTDVIQTGRFRVFVTRTDRMRPAPGGVSIGHRDITAGTLGCLVKKNGVIHILSNNHVLANSNAASPGDAILQPAPMTVELIRRTISPIYPPLYPYYLAIPRADAAWQTGWQNY